MKFFFKEGENKKESRRLNVRRKKCDRKRRKNRESKIKMINMERKEGWKRKRRNRGG